MYVTWRERAAERYVQSIGNHEDLKDLGSLRTTPAMFLISNASSHSLMARVRDATHLPMLDRALVKLLICLYCPLMQNLSLSAQPPKCCMCA